MYGENFCNMKKLDDSRYNYYTDDMHDSPDACGDNETEKKER